MIELEPVGGGDPRLPAGLRKAAEASPGVFRCLFFKVLKAGTLTAHGSDACIVLCARGFRRFLVLTRGNALEPGVWDVRQLMRTSLMPPNIVVSLLVSVTGPAWSDLATPLDQHGDFASYERPDDKLPLSAERLPPGLSADDGVYRWMLNALDPEAMPTVKDGGVKVGPLAMAKFFGVDSGHMPRIFYDATGACFVRYRTFLEVILVYGQQAASSVLQRYVVIDGVSQPIPGCTVEGSVVTLTIELHFNLAAGRTKHMWHTVRDRAAQELTDEAEPFIEKAPDGEMLRVLPQSASGDAPNAREICAAGIVIAVAERRRHRMSNVLADARDFPPCLRLDPKTFWESNTDAARRQQIFTMTGLEAEGYKGIADKLRLVLESVYNNAYRPIGVSDAEFKLKWRTRRNSVFRRHNKQYPSPKCKNCPLPVPCQPNLTLRVSEVIRANAERRSSEDAGEDAEIDGIMAEMDL